MSFLSETTLSIGGHHSTASKSDVWLTPPEILEALGPFDLDPCAAPEPRPWATAARHIALPTNGLSEPWEGRVWCNPPYGAVTWRWLGRLASHGNGIALVFARTETEGFFGTVWRAASACLFLERRLHFHHRDGRRADANAGAPSVLVAYGESNVGALRSCGLSGALVEAWRA